MRLLLAPLLLSMTVPLLGQQATDETPRPVYAVAQILIEDRETYREYERGFGAVFNRHEGEIVAVSESPDVVEGEWPWTRTVLLRFPSKQAFDAWYQSDEYQEIVKHRWAASKTNLIVLEGRP